MSLQTDRPADEGAGDAVVREERQPDGVAGQPLEPEWRTLLVVRRGGVCELSADGCYFLKCGRTSWLRLGMGGVVGTGWSRRRGARRSILLS